MKMCAVCVCVWCDVCPCVYRHTCICDVCVHVCFYMCLFVYWCVLIFVYYNAIFMCKHALPINMHNSCKAHSTIWVSNYKIDSDLQINYLVSFFYTFNWWHLVKFLYSHNGITILNNLLVLFFRCNHIQFYCKSIDRFSYLMHSQNVILYDVFIYYVIYYNIVCYRFFLNWMSFCKNIIN